MAEAIASRAGSALLAAATVVAVGSSCLYTVDAGQRAIVFNRLSGIDHNPKGEGLHVAIPWFQTPYLYDITRRPKVISSGTGTKDLQTVQIQCRILFKPSVDKLGDIHTKLGGDYDERVLPSIGNEVLKSVIAQYDAEQLLTQRARVSDEIRQALTERASSFNILLDDVAITHLQYGREFAQAIEQKQVAEQEAERQKYIVMKAEQERQANVIRAEGEAEAAEMISKSLKEHGTGIIDVRRIDAAKEIAVTLSGNQNISYLPGGGGQQLLINASR